MVHKIHLTIKQIDMSQAATPARVQRRGASCFWAPSPPPQDAGGLGAWLGGPSALTSSPCRSEEEDPELARHESVAAQRRAGEHGRRLPYW